MIEVEVGQFGQAQARRIEQFKDGLVATGDEVIVDTAIEQLQGAVGVQHLGQPAFALGRAQTAGRVVLAQAFTVEIAVQATHRRQQPGQAARGLAVMVLAGDQLAQLLNLQRLPTGNAVLLAVCNHLVQVATVAQQGVLGHLALVAQVCAISLQLVFHQRTGRRVWVTRGTTRPSTSAM